MRTATSVSQNRVPSLDLRAGPQAARATALWGLVRMARPASLLRFVAVPTATICYWLRGETLSSGELLTLLLTFVCMDAGLTTLNDICDRDTDATSTEAQRNTRPAAAGTVPLRWAYTQVILLEACALALGFAISVPLGLLLSVGVVFGVLYSARPVRISGRPVLSQVFFVCFWLAYYTSAYLAVGGEFQRGALYLAGTILFMAVGETLAKDLRDLDNDGLTSKRTTPVVFGSSPAAAASFPAFCAGALLYLLAAVELGPDQRPVGLAVLVVMVLWCSQALLLARSLRRQYTKEDARSLHEGSIAAFTTVNLLFIVALS